MRSMLSRLPSIARLAGFGLALLTAGCAAAPGGMTTASIRPRPDEGMMQRPAYTPSSTLGAPQGARPITTASLQAPTRQPAPFKTYHYPWNGNRERIQTGAISQRTREASTIKWKASAPGSPVRLASNATQTAPVETHTPAREIIVSPGDTLFSLSTKHNVPMTALMQANNLQSPAIKVSQHLILPAAR